MPDQHNSDGARAQHRFIPIRADGRVVALVGSLALHVAVLALAGNHQSRTVAAPRAPTLEKTVISLQLLPAAPPRTSADALRHVVRPPRAAAARPRIEVAQHTPSPAAVRQPAVMEAPPAPTAQDWALAGSYTLKNSKRYRYTWGRQVRSMMGRAVEGPQQGAVRFLVEIAPDGTLARLQTVWATSRVAERLARKAIEHLPPLPPTPTGRPLVFERTILFDAFASEAPPIYANDCLPDPPSFEDPFAWDGKSPQLRAAPQPVHQPDAREMGECLKQVAQDSIEAETAHDQRQFDRWGSSKLAR